MIRAVRLAILIACGTSFAQVGFADAQVGFAEECIIGKSLPLQEETVPNPIHDPLEPNWSAHTSTHGQLIFGTNTIYLHHLAVPMIDPADHPHSFQVLLEVSFREPDADAFYKAEVASNPDSIFTAVPPQFDQTALAVTYPGYDPLRTLPETTVVRGHFEQGGQPFLRDVIEIEQLVHFREFSLEVEPIPHLTYMLFGDENEIFLAHYIDGTVPNFDSILEVRIDDEAADVDLSEPLFVQMPSRANVEDQRIREGEAVQCTLDVQEGQATTIELQVVREIYCEAGEFSEFVTKQFNRPRRCAD